MRARVVRAGEAIEGVVCIVNCRAKFTRDDLGGCGRDAGCVTQCSANRSNFAPFFASCRKIRNNSSGE
mgnify:CR=1 FL=1